MPSAQALLRNLEGDLQHGKTCLRIEQSLDGYIDHTKFVPSLALFHHFIDHIRGVTGIVYGRGMYEVMRYWDEDQPSWKAHEHEFATAILRRPARPPLRLLASDQITDDVIRLTYVPL